MYIYIYTIYYMIYDFCYIILYHITSYIVLYYIVLYCIILYYICICIWVWPNQEVLTASLTSFARSSSNWWSIHTQKLGFRLDVCRPRQTPRKFAPVTHICLRSMKKDDGREWLQQAQRTDYFNPSYSPRKNQKKTYSI